MFIEKRKFKNSKGLTLSAIYEGEDRSAPVVVMCHGFASSKDSEPNSDLAQKLVKKRLNVYRFDFTGCGESEGTLDECTPNQGLDDLKSAIKNLNKEKFALYGSSYGGFISLMYSLGKPLLALGLKAPVSDYLHQILQKTTNEYKSKDFYRQAKDINIYKVAKNIKTPILIVHGSDDEVVPLEQSKKLLEALGGEKNLSLIHGGTHQMHGPAMEDAHNQLTEFFVNKLL